MKEQLSFYETEIKSILGLPPSWLLWSGGYLIVGLLVILISLGFFWKHPEVYTISTQNLEPIDLLQLELPIGATLDSVLITDRQQVEVGEALLLYRKGAFREAMTSPQTGQIFWLGDNQNGAFLALRPDPDPYRINLRVDNQHLALLKVGQKVSLRATDTSPIFGHIEHFVPEKGAFAVQIKTLEPSPLSAFTDDLELSFILNEKPIFAKLLNN